jgi:hypothetical protein
VIGLTTDYQTQPFKDSNCSGDPQSIPGKVMCAYYDFGGEGLAYHDTTDKNQGSGKLNPPDGSYLNEFRIAESVDTSYTKADGIDDSPYNYFDPEMGLLYVGWTAPGEWLKYTVNVIKAGIYTVNILYTSNCGGAISLSINDKNIAGPIQIISTYRAEDEVEWRQWHHWNIMENIAEIALEEGVQILTLHTVEEGQMNYAYLEFIENDSKSRKPLLTQPL